MTGADDPPWVMAVVAAVTREIELGWRRSALPVFKGSDDMYHVTRRVNRESIERLGLHSRFMTSVLGVAGSTSTEWPGTFLCDEESIEFFAEMPAPDPVDAWAADVSGRWLQGAPHSDGGGSYDWVIAEDLIQPPRLRVVRPRI